MKRRGVLKLTLWGGGALALTGVGVGLWPSLEHHRPRRALRVVDRAGFNVLATAAVRIVPPDGDPVEIAHRVDDALFEVPPEAQQDFRNLLRALESGLVGLLLDARPRPFSRHEGAGQDGALGCFRDSRIVDRRAGYQSLRKLCLAAYYASDSTWAAIGYPGPVGACSGADVNGFVDAGTLGASKRLTPEVCIIGSGAGGAVTAALLAGAGHEVLVVEEGGHRTRKDFNMREDVAFRTLYQDGGARTTKDRGVSILQGRAVGGTTVINWTTCFRTPEHVLEHWRDRFGVTGFSPGDLAPHFAAIEERLSIAEIPLEHSNRNNRLLYDGCQALNIAAAPTRRNVKQCMKSGYCGMGCPIDAKQSMLITYLPDAIGKGAAVLSRCRVDRLEVEAGKVARAHCSVLGPDGRTPTGSRVEIAARRFILSAGAINSPAVLIRSGLAGAGSPVGRRTFLHPTIGTASLYRDPVEPYYGAPQSIASHAYSQRGADCGIFLEAAPIHPMLAALSLPSFGEAHRKLMLALPRLSAHIALAIDGFGPDETGGTVVLPDSGAPQLDYPLPPRIWEALRTGLKTLARIDLAAGAEVVHTSHDPGVAIRSHADLALIDAAPFDTARLAVFSAHVMGGCAMGSDPARAVVRPEDLRHHTLDNLHVIDGSVLPTSLGVNPQETIYGLAHAVATRLQASWAR